MMLKLSDRNWKEFNAFSTDGLFEIHTTNSSIDKNKLLSGDTLTVPYVSRSGGSNGVSKFVSSENYRYGFDNGESITVGLDTQTAFYQPYKFVTGQNIQVITGEHLTPSVIQFLLPLFRSQMTAKFNWGGNGATLSRMKRLKLLLPVNAMAQPDYAFMSDYVDQQKKQLQTKYVSYAQKKLQVLGTQKSLKPLSELDWGTFFLNELFDVDPGVRLTNQDKKTGKKPFIGAVDNNNGVTGFVGNVNKSQDSNVLGVNYNGAPGIAFYHPYAALFSDDVKRLKLKDRSHNTRNVLLFMKTIVMKQRGKYNYGYKFNASRMSRQKLYVPVNELGQPDYDYMEQYVKNKMIQKYNHYLKYLNESVIGSNKL